MTRIQIYLQKGIKHTEKFDFKLPGGRHLALSNVLGESTT